MKSHYKRREDAKWVSLNNSHGEEVFHIPTSFMADLLEGKVQLDTSVQYSEDWATQMMHDSLSDIGYDVKGLTRRLEEQFQQRVDTFFVNANVRYSCARNLGKTLLNILPHHDHHGDDSDLSLARHYLKDTGHNHLMAQAYLVGRGLCMHVASLGVAIARANGVPARIIGNPNYFEGIEPAHHYGLQVWENDGWQTIIPRKGYRWWETLKFRMKLSGFRPITDQ